MANRRNYMLHIAQHGECYFGSNALLLVLQWQEWFEK
jgi:hypothetical protein